MNPEEKKEFIEGLQVYYKMKQNYEEKIKKEKQKIIKMENISWRQKKNIFRKFIPKCINCNKSGGTLFTTKYVENDNGRRITAVCGNFQNPCSLDIAINLGKIRLINEILIDDEKDIKEYKREIIKDKNDLIFGYIDKQTASEKFEYLKENLNETISLYELTLDNYSYILKKEQDKKEIEELKDDIKNSIKIIKEYFSKNNTNDKSMHYIIELHDNLINSNKKLRSILYPVMYIDKEDNVYCLEKKEYSIDSFEQNYGNKFGIEKLNFGVGLKKDEYKTTQQKKINFRIVDDDSNGSELSE